MLRAVLKAALLALIVVLVSCGDDAAETEDFETDTSTSDTDTTDTDTSDTEDTDSEEPSCQVSDLCNSSYCEQIMIPAGEFTMGSEIEPAGSPGPEFGYGDERPPHAVYLEAFCIDKFEVTYERYLACVNAGVCDPSGHTWNGASEIPGYPIVVNHYPDECMSDPAPCMQYAVNCRSMEAAAVYCEWLGMELCTEAQWERAAKGPSGDNRPYPWGYEEPTKKYANLQPWGLYVAPVDSFELDVTDEGVRQMAGNVVEWVSDYYAPYEVPPSGDPVVNPEGPENGKYNIGRGGCFFDVAVTNQRRQTLDPDFDKG